MIDKSQDFSAAESPIFASRSLYQRVEAQDELFQEGSLGSPFTAKIGHFPLYVLAKIPFLLEKKGLGKEALELASSLLPLFSFPSLWCSEKNFFERNLESSREKLADFAKDEPSYPPPAPLDVKFLEKGEIKSAFTLSGQECSLGHISCRDAQIFALGPQSKDFLFGIQGEGESNWVRTYASVDSWIEVKTFFEERTLCCQNRFIGSKPFFYAIYARAPLLEIDQKVLYPKSLDRYTAVSSSFTLAEKGLKVSWNGPRKIEVIPLSGDPGFYWGCQFLILFEITSFSPMLSLRFAASETLNLS